VLTLRGSDFLYLVKAAAPPPRRFPLGGACGLRPVPAQRQRRGAVV